MPGRPIVNSKTLEVFNAASKITIVARCFRHFSFNIKSGLFGRFGAMPWQCGILGLGVTSRCITKVVFKQFICWNTSVQKTLHARKQLMYKPERRHSVFWTPLLKLCLGLVRVQAVQGMTSSFHYQRAALHTNMLQWYEKGAGHAGTWRADSHSDGAQWLSPSCRLLRASARQAPSFFIYPPKPLVRSAATCNRCFRHSMAMRTSNLAKICQNDFGSHVSGGQ